MTLPAFAASTDCAAACRSPDVRTPFKCGLTCQSRGLLVDAERCYQHVLSVQPRHFDALHMLGVISIQTRRLDRAIKLIRNALKQNSRVAAAHRNLALALKNMGRIEEALVSYGRAIALQPDYADTYVHLASALTDLRRPEEALPHCDRAIVLRPQDPFAHLAKAVALRSMQRPEDVLASCDAAIAAQSNCAEAWDKRGAALQVARTVRAERVQDRHFLAGEHAACRSGSIIPAEDASFHLQHSGRSLDQRSKRVWD
jgi:tetratricopeptide (TPR) repeat protein